MYDVDGQFEKRCNLSMVGLERVLPEDEQMQSARPWQLHAGRADEAQLRQLIENHHRWTGSQRASDLLDDWEGALRKFVKVMPHEYARALKERAEGERQKAEGDKFTPESMGAGPSEKGGQGVLTK